MSLVWSSIVTNPEVTFPEVFNPPTKVLTREGKNFAVARAFYFVSSGKVRDIDAWLIRPDSTTKSYDKKSVLDIIAESG